MIDISNLTINRCDNQIIPYISLCGKLEAFIGGYFLSNVLPESKVETLYYDATIDNVYSEPLCQDNYFKKLSWIFNG